MRTEMKKLVSLLLGLTLALSLSLPALAADTLTDGSVTVTVDGEAVTEVPVMVPLRPVAGSPGLHRYLGRLPPRRPGGQRAPCIRR